MLRLFNANRMQKLINFSELSRYITKGDRNSIRSNKIPKKHIDALDRLFYVDLPKWWGDLKKDYNEK